jgi:predicted SAM-dependent methyltransferase
MRRIRLSQEIDLVDLGCGKIKNNGVGIDREDFGQDIVWDILSCGIPLADNSVKKFHLAHFIEHVKNEEIEGLFREMYRVGKHNCYIKVITPIDISLNSYYPNHVSWWNEQRVEGLVKGFNNKRMPMFVILDNRYVPGREELQFTLQIKKAW